MYDAREKRQTWLVCLGLTIAVLAAYGQVWHHGFITYDDPDYITTNPHIQDGVTWAGIKWAFTIGYAANWHPLTWISHMLDVQLYGMNPAGHHLTNVALHLANSVLLFLLVRRMTKLIWPSAFVAALFALHPLHVESVAWVAERKDVLSTFFGMLSIWAWLGYVEQKRRSAYMGSVILFALGLMAKPMLVTLPFVLLLLDYWPLQRRPVPLSRLLVEKIPFFMLAAGSCVVTFMAQRDEAVVSTSALSFSERLADAPVAYVRYLGKIVWPSNLALFYPLFAWPGSMVAACVAILLLCSGLALWRARPQPWVIMGWLWFLGTLVPVIGLVQVGLQAMADRYTYIPSIGLFIGLVWTVRELIPRVAGVLGALAVAACLFLTWRQAGFWQDSPTLLLHAIETTTNNAVAYTMLGTYEGLHGNPKDALRYLKTSLQIKPDYARARDELGRVLLANGEIDKALTNLQAAVAMDPRLPDAHYNLGYALLAKGRVGEALDQFQAQVNLQPDDFLAQFNMGSVLLQNGLPLDALAFLEKAIELKPADAEAHYLLGNGLFRVGNVTAAMSQFEEAIQFDPGHIQARNDLAWILACNPQASIRDGARAVALALRADQIAGGTNAVVLGTLAAGYAEAGKFADAIAADKRACQVAQAETNSALAELLAKQLRSYEAGSPWRDGTK